MGNWHEPRPYPEKRAQQAEASLLPAWLWWALRNPLHNLNHFWLGIVPRAKRYQWIIPQETGWKRIKNPHSNWSRWTKKNRLPLPYYRIDDRWTLYIGWLERGNFGLALRRN